MSHIVPYDIYSYSLEDATKMKQLAPVFLQVHSSNHFDLLIIIRYVFHLSYLERPKYKIAKPLLYTVYRTIIIIIIITWFI